MVRWKEKRFSTCIIFQDFFESILLKIISGVFYVICATLFNVFNFLVIMFEKYGGDPMKRSLDNILTTHHMMGYLLNNNMVTPFFTLRVIFGPIHSYVATFVAVTENFVVTWGLCEDIVV